MLQDKRGGISLVLSQTWLCCAPRVSSDTPRLKAFWRVAPSVRFKVRAIFAARVLLPASFFNVRISLAVQPRRFFISVNSCRRLLILNARNALVGSAFPSVLTELGRPWPELNSRLVGVSSYKSFQGALSKTHWSWWRRRWPWRSGWRRLGPRLRGLSGCECWLVHGTFRSKPVRDLH
jgi:hypothetical protein